MVKVKQKRYQRYTKDGIEWTDWFNYSENAPETPWQVKNKLKNEFRYIEVEEKQS